MNACPGDKIEVAATLVVAPNGTDGILKIPQTLPWNVDLSGLPQEDIDYLRRSCESDLPCVGHFKISVLRITHPVVTLQPGEWWKGTWLVPIVLILIFHHIQLQDRPVAARGRDRYWQD